MSSFEYFIRKTIDWDELEDKFFKECTGIYQRSPGMWFGYKKFKKKPQEVFEFFKSELTK
jgi:hypothetical protein